MTPILLLEINEVPWRLLDRYLGRVDYPSLNRFFGQSSHYTTVAVDTGELSPWVTWPTLHRGMNNELHGIKNLGQNSSTFKGMPIWEEIRSRGGAIGVCGSMQSWPPLDPGEGGFYIPDTFAHDERCYPAYLNPLQAFNLEQVRSNPRVVRNTLPSLSEVMRIAASSMKAGISIRTASRIAAHLLQERINRSLTKKRPIIQAVLFWDVFCKHFDARRPPMFSTFFTNHVAGVMHRYWKDVFPEDFPDQPIAEGASNEWLMRFSLDVLEDMFRVVLRWTALNPDLVVVFASSMGQDAVHRDSHEGIDLVVENVGALMSQTGLARSDYVTLLAMAPQIAVEIQNESLRTRTRSILEQAHCGDGNRFMRVQIIGTSLSITVATPPRNELAGDVFWLAGKSVKWEHAGIRKQETEAGTGYHIPEGSLAVYSRQRGQTLGDQSRRRVNADLVKNWLLAVSTDGHSRIPSLSQLSA